MVRERTWELGLESVHFKTTPLSLLVHRNLGTVPFLSFFSDTKGTEMVLMKGIVGFGCVMVSHAHVG